MRLSGCFEITSRSHCGSLLPAVVDPSARDSERRETRSARFSPPGLAEDAAKAFFIDELLQRVTGLYGVRPTVEFVQIATLVENLRA